MNREQCLEANCVCFRSEWERTQHVFQMLRAQQALKDLTDAMREMTYLSATGQQITAADNCRELLEMMGYCIRAVATYVNVPL